MQRMMSLGQDFIQWAPGKFIVNFFAFDTMHRAEDTHVHCPHHFVATTQCVCGWSVQFYKIKLCLFIIRNVVISYTRTRNTTHPIMSAPNVLCDLTFVMKSWYLLWKYTHRCFPLSNRLVRTHKRTLRCIATSSLSLRMCKALYT